LHAFKKVLPSQIAQVAELVDALVSNTNVFGRAGSSPALGTTIRMSLGVSTKITHSQTQTESHTDQTGYLSETQFSIVNARKFTLDIGNLILCQMLEHINLK
jgi:hypothetical protein